MDEHLLGTEESSTAQSLSAEAARELPTLAAATVAGIVFFILLAIAVLFTLGVLLDCRHQSLDNKLRISRTRARRRPIAVDVESEGAGIAGNMQPSDMSTPPAHLQAAP